MTFHCNYNVHGQIQRHIYYVTCHKKITNILEICGKKCVKLNITCVFLQKSWASTLDFTEKSENNQALTFIH